MAMLFMDSFDHMATADLPEKYASIDGSTAPVINTGRFTNGLDLRDGNTPASVTKVVPSHTTSIVGFALHIVGFAGADKQIFAFRENATEHVTLLYQNSTQKLYLSYPGGTTLGSTVLVAGVWYYVEMKVVIDNATGSVELRVNEISEGTATNVDTRNGGTGIIDTICMRAGSSTVGSNNRRYDDLYVCDNTGATNNDFLGDLRIQCIRPDGNGNSSQLVGSDGNSTDNYLLVDESTANDADYVESSTPGDKDTYTYGNLTPTTGSVYAVQPVPRAAKTDAGSRSIVSVARLSGTETDGPVQTLSTSALYYPDVRETKPGGGAWSISDVNSAEFGVKVNA